MGKSVKIFDDLQIVNFLNKHEFDEFYNRYAPSSLFYSKVIADNSKEKVVVFVRKDWLVDDLKKQTYGFEAWKQTYDKRIVDGVVATDPFGKETMNIRLEKSTAVVSFLNKLNRMIV